MELLITSDQSHTLYHPVLNETYHSKSGAIGESDHIYIQAGLDFAATKHNTTIRIFELGFGTGLNALLTWMYAEKNQQPIWYETVEKHPLSNDISGKLNYGSQLKQQEKFDTLHNAAWNEPVIASPHLTLQKHHVDVLDFAFPTSYFHLVYYDAFAPSKQEEVWGMPLLEKIAQSLQPNGVLVTYCAQGQFKRNLKSTGFELDILPGPFKKKEMTRAIKK